MRCSGRVLTDAKGNADQIRRPEPDLIAHGYVAPCIAIRCGRFQACNVFLEIRDRFSCEGLGFVIESGDATSGGPRYLRVVDVDVVFRFLAFLFYRLGHNIQAGAEIHQFRGEEKRTSLVAVCVTPRDWEDKLCLTAARTGYGRSAEVAGRFPCVIQLAQIEIALWKNLAVERDRGANSLVEIVAV